MTDIIVIGGGIAGLSVAARLSDAAHVTLLEAEESLGFHASGRSAAMFEENYGPPGICALSRASHSFFDSGGYLRQRGFLLVGKSEETAFFESDMAFLGCTEIDVAAARAMVPVLSHDVARAAHHAEAADIDTDRLLQDFARTVKANGGTICTRAPVTALARTAHNWQVTAGAQTYRAAIIVNAAGAWADLVAQMAGVRPLGLQPKRRSMARIPAPDGHNVTNWPLLMGPGERWYAKPDAGMLIVSPADADPAEPHDAWADDMVLAEGLARYEAYVTAPVTRVVASWAGLRTFSPDGEPVLGFAPDAPGFVWCAGQGGYGFQSAPAASAMLADILLGRTPDCPPALVASFSPTRFS